MEASLREAALEYETALRQGKDVRSSVVHGHLPGALPSPRLHAINKMFAARPRGGPPASELFALAALPAIRAGFAESWVSLTGPLAVPAVFAEELKATRGVDAHFVTFPGVDAASDAATLLYFHGGAWGGGVVGTAVWSS